MPRIYVEFAGLKQIGNDCKAISSKINKIQSDFQRTIKQLDWDVKYESNINNTANQITQKLEQYTHALVKYHNFINNAYDEYVQLNQEKKLDLNSSINDYLTIDSDISRPLGPTGNPFTNWWNRFEELLNDVKKEKDVLSVAKTLLGCSGSSGDIGEADILKNLISYIEDFSNFFMGDKKGLTGASDWCNLASSSIGTWTGLYNYYSDMYKGLETGFFGDIAKKDVKVLGLSASFLALTTSILSASNGLDEKKWQSIVADYVDCGKDIISVINSGYELKHIGDIKSLADIKVGPWSALDIYAAIGNSVVQSVSQGFRSHEKYFADGQWDIGDTGATSIDISMSGLYGITHSLTLGLDDIIFGIVDNATGGNGTHDMSYPEKAAEGYKILANECGKAIKNWWINLMK